MKALIFGCGWLGCQLASSLAEAGWTVAGTRRSAAALAGLPAGVQGLCWDGQSGPSAEVLAAASDSWLICALPPAAATDGGRAYLAALTQITALAPAARGVVLCSSTGVYSGLRGDVTEAAAPGPAARAALLWQAEQLVLACPRSYVLRLAGLVGPGRHPAGFCRQGVLSGASDPVNLVHSTDVCLVLLQLIRERPRQQVFNLRTPLTLTKQQFYTAACLRAGVALPLFSAATTPGHQVDGSAVSRFLNFHYQFTDLVQASS